MKRTTRTLHITIERTRHGDGSVTYKAYATGDEEPDVWRAVEALAECEASREVEREPVSTLRQLLKVRRA